MRQKCMNCNGKGGFYPLGKRVVSGLWISCSLCKGSGKLFGSDGKPRRKADLKDIKK